MTRPASSAIHDDPTQTLRADGVWLGEHQARRLRWVSRTFGPPVRWDRLSEACGGRTILVLDPPTGAGAELLVSSLTSHDAVVIPLGENPAFDFLKSKLTEFGTVGASADGPHELWWGGLGWPAPVGAHRPDALRVVSCHARTIGDLHIYHLRRSLERLGLAFEIEASDSGSGDRLTAADRADFVTRMWQRHKQPLLFVEPDVMLQAVPDLPELTGCDFAVHKWNGWEMSARTLYFGRSKAAETMLRTWSELARTFPDVWDGYLIDQAWSAVTSQIALDTVWLPRSYHAVAGQLAARSAVVVHNLKPTSGDLGPDPDFATMVRPARRAGRVGASDALLVLCSGANSDKAVTVILREVDGRSARETADSIDAVTRAFVADCGGFGRLELSLCSWQPEARIAREAAFLADNMVFEVVPGQHLPENLFRTIAAAEAGRRPDNVETYRR
ncbi:hypothetical protein [Bradyrhizobium sp.]|uniref:hypothetical protein n=1 Tax=Bradyrhizobium sp. TaxID=376 RepID=UPI003919DAC7